MSRHDRELRLSNAGRPVWLLPMMACWIAGCGNPVTTTPPGPAAAGAPPLLRIAAASDLQAALPRLGDRFRSRGGVAIEPTFTSSGVLAQQIKQGAPYDVFLSANEAFVRDLAKAGSIRPDSVHPYARGSLVLAIHRDLTVGVESLADLAKPEVKKIALANPETAPYGRAGKQALERAGLWDRLRPKLVIAESVRQALLYAQKGDAEAALVAHAIAGGPEVRTVAIDPGLYEPIVQTLGVVADSPNRAEAEAFVTFVLGDGGQAILKEFGFRPAPGDEVPAGAEPHKAPGKNPR